MRTWLRMTPVLALAWLAGAGCSSFEPQPLGCGAPDEAIPGPSVDIYALGDGDLELEIECGVTLLDYDADTVLMQLDCASQPVGLQIPAARAPELADGTVTLKVSRTEESLDLRVLDSDGLVLVVLDGVLEPASEGFVSWQLETDCSREAGLVAGHLVVRVDTGEQERRVDVGESEFIERMNPDDSSDPFRWELRTFAAEFELGTGNGVGSAAIVRRDD